MKVPFIAVLINALHFPLKDAEIAFDGVCVNCTANVLTSAVRREIVIGETIAQLGILERLVGVDDGFRRDVFAQDRQKRGNFQVFYNNAFFFAAGAVNEREHLVL